MSPLFDSRERVDDSLFELLANTRRRLLLQRLVDRGGEASLRDLSRDVAVHETDADPETIDSNEITRVYVSLYQTHVPALEEGDLVDYDDTQGVVYLDDCPDGIADILENWRRRRRRWARYYLLVAVVLAGPLVAYVFLPVAVSEAVLSVFTFGAAMTLLLLVVAHYYGVRVSPLAGHPFDDLKP